MKRTALYISIVLVFNACKKDEFELRYKPVDKQYFSSQIGAYSIYKVHEIIFDDFTNTVDTTDYQVMEVNESHFRDNLDRDAIRIDRYRRPDDSTAWTYMNTWYAVVNNSMAERVEDNKRLVKLSFPISAEATWNANTFNTDNANNVFYVLMHDKYKMDNFKFDSVVSVESTTRINLTVERVFKEVYAKGIGLVYKNHVNTDSGGGLKRGFKITYTLYKYGH